MRMNAMLFAKAGPVPALVSVGAFGSGGNLCASQNWLISVSWSLTAINDAEYEIDIIALGGLASSQNNLATSGSPWIDDTGFQGNTDGTLTEQVTAQYRVQVVRKSDSVVVSEMDTNIETLDYSLEFCV